MRVEWSADEVIGSWTLVDEDWRLVANKSGATRLGFALLLKFFELEARFPAGPEELPPAAVSYVAGQVKVDPAELAVYRWTGRTVEYYRAQIRDAFGFREFARGDHDKLAEWLAEEVCPVELRDEQLREALAVRCRAERLEPPGQPDRIIGTALFEKTFCERITVRLGDDGAARLEALVTAPGSSAGGSGRGLLAELKADPGQVSLETLLREVDKLAGVKALRLPGVVRGLFGAVGGGVAGSRDAFVPVGSGGGRGASAVDVVGGVVLDAVGGDHRRAGGSAAGAGAQDQRPRGASGGEGADRGFAAGAGYVKESDADPGQDRGT